MKDVIKKAFESAEQEVQEKEIGHIKSIIKNLLQKKLDKEKKRDELEDEIRLIKKTIEDFKEGRLDKVKELIDTDPKAKEVVPIIIKIIKDTDYERNPFKPRYWNYEMEWSVNNCNDLVYRGSLTSNCGTVNLVSGGQTATFTSGTYEVNNKIINI